MALFSIFLVVVRAPCCADLHVGCYGLYFSRLADSYRVVLSIGRWCRHYSRWGVAGRRGYDVSISYLADFELDCVRSINHFTYLRIPSRQAGAWVALYALIVLIGVANGWRYLKLDWSTIVSQSVRMESVTNRS